MVDMNPLSIYDLKTFSPVLWGNEIGPFNKKGCWVGISTDVQPISLGFWEVGIKRNLLFPDSTGISRA